MTSQDSDELLRARLAALDPMPPDDLVDPVSSPRAQELLERIMTMPTATEPLASAALAARRRWRRPAGFVAAAAAVVAVVVGTSVLSGAFDDPKPRPTPAAAPTTLALAAPGGGGVSLGSCIPFDVNLLKDMPVALAGTVTAVDAGKVTLKVDRWYRGGDADQVTVSQPDPQSSVALDGVSFEQGKRYLLTATNGTVNVCGFSGLATSDLQKSFEEAFPG